MDQDAPTWSLFRTALVISALIILFFSGIFPVEELISLAPRESLTASIVPAEVATLTNKERSEQGLASLSINPVLTQAAQMKAEHMAKNSYYAHVSPDGKTPLYWLDVVGYKYLNAGENLVIDRDTSKQAVDAWMNSETHRANILRPQFTEIGIGVAAGEYKGIETIYVVQEFATPYPSKIVRPAATPITSKPLAAKSPAPDSLTKPTIVTSVQTLATPLVGKGTAPAKPAVKAPTTTLAVVSTTTTATSTFTFTLAPEFFAPVTIDEGASTTQESPLAANRLNWTLRLRTYAENLSYLISRIIP